MLIPYSDCDIDLTMIRINCCLPDNADMNMTKTNQDIDFAVLIVGKAKHWRLTIESSISPFVWTYSTTHMFDYAKQWCEKKKK